MQFGRQNVLTYACRGINQCVEVYQFMRARDVDNLDQSANTESLSVPTYAWIMGRLTPVRSTKVRETQFPDFSESEYVLQHSYTCCHTHCLSTYGMQARWRNGDSK